MVSHTCCHLIVLAALTWTKLRRRAPCLAKPMLSAPGVPTQRRSLWPDPPGAILFCSTPFFFFLQKGHSCGCWGKRAPCSPSPTSPRLQSLPRARVPRCVPCPSPAHHHSQQYLINAALRGVPAPSAGHGTEMRAGAGRLRAQGRAEEALRADFFFGGGLPSLQQGALNEPMLWGEKKSTPPK